MYVFLELFQVSIFLFADPSKSVCVCRAVSGVSHACVRVLVIVFKIGYIVIEA